MLAAGTTGANLLRAQEGGMATRGIKAQPSGKPSGLPFRARFTDVAAQAGLRSPIIYGPVGGMDYILESVGCGVAFLDYDNDGWISFCFQVPAARGQWKVRVTDFTRTIVTAPLPLGPVVWGTPVLSMRRSIH